MAPSCRVGCVACVYAKDSPGGSQAYRTEFPFSVAPGRAWVGNELLFSVSGILDRLLVGPLNWAINKRETMALTYRHDRRNAGVVFYASISTPSLNLCQNLPEIQHEKLVIDSHD